MERLNLAREKRGEEREDIGHTLTLVASYDTDVEFIPENDQNI